MVRPSVYQRLFLVAVPTAGFGISMVGTIDWYMLVMRQDIATPQGRIITTINVKRIVKFFLQANMTCGLTVCIQINLQESWRYTFTLNLVERLLEVEYLSRLKTTGLRFASKECDVKCRWPMEGENDSGC